MRTRKKFKRTVYILTEGVTEEAYFGRLAEIIGEDDANKYAVHVEVREIVDGVAQDPVNMVAEAEKQLKDYDEVWVVFDRDRARDSQNRAAINQAAVVGVLIAFSSISFEHFVLLHFERNNTAFQRSDCESRSTAAVPIVCGCQGTVCVCARLRMPGLYPGFRKAKSLLYDDLEPRNTTAIENSAWLRRVIAPIGHVADTNPYTDVDRLLCKLLNLPMVDQFFLGDAFLFDRLRVTVTGLTPRAGGVEATVRFRNEGVVTVVINNTFGLSLVGQLGCPIIFEPIATVTILQGTEADVRFRFLVGGVVGPYTLKLRDVERYVMIG